MINLKKKYTYKQGNKEKEKSVMLHLTVFKNIPKTSVGEVLRHSVLK